MKKSLLLAILSIAFSSLSFGQLRVLVPGASQPLNNGDTVAVFGNSTDEMNLNLYVINTGFKETVLARRDSVLLFKSLITGNEFCWGGYCYDTTFNISQLSETIAQGDTANGIGEFTGHYTPYGHLGAAYIKYTFYDQNGPGPTDGWVIVKYDATPASVQNISNGIRLAAPYPNPANSFATINYSLNNGVQTANLKIFNLLGKCIETYPLSSLQTKTNIDVQSMQSGIYICEMQAQGCQPVYQKMVVSH
jgi:hypothetical protein